MAIPCEIVLEQNEWAAFFAPTACVVCHQHGLGMTQLPDLRHVHRWPCQQRLLTHGV